MSSSDRPTSRAAQYRELLATYLRPQWPKVSLMAGLLLGSIGLQLFSPQILRNFIDTAGAGGSLDALTNLALLFLAVAVVTQLVASFATYFSEDVGWTATNALRADLTRHCLNLDPSFHKEHTAGELIERVDGDVLALAGFFSEFVVRVLGNLLLMLGIIGLMALQDWRIALVILIYAALTLGIIRRVQQRVTPYVKASRQSAADLSSFWGEQLVGREDLVSSGAASYVTRRYFELQRQYNRRNFVSQFVFRLLDATFSLLSTGAIVIVLGLSGVFYTNGSLTLGVVYLLYSYVSILNDNLIQLSDQFDDLQQATASIERLNELYHVQSRLTDGPGLDWEAGPPAVEFQGVSFSYTSDGPSVLHDLSFRLEGGQVLGLLGRSGSGKTTLTRLLFRFYDPTGGQVCLAGQDMRLARLAELRGQIGIVTQEVQLFQATLRDNLTFFDRQITDEQLVAALEQLGLHDWYTRLPDGLDTPLVPGGLSAGEAQLLALTRVFLKNPRLVILDEASSRLDPATERLTFRAIQALLQGRTAIIIAHRLMTVEQADHIMVMENGRIAEYDRRSTLVADPASRYASLLQTGLVEETAAAPPISTN